jgi:hypothetical protein
MQHAASGNKMDGAKVWIDNNLKNKPWQVKLTPASY